MQIRRGYGLAKYFMLGQIGFQGRTGDYQAGATPYHQAGVIPYVRRRREKEAGAQGKSNDPNTWRVGKNGFSIGIGNPYVPFGKKHFCSWENPIFCSKGVVGKRSMDGSNPERQFTKASH